MYENCCAQIHFSQHTNVLAYLMSFRTNGLHDNDVLHPQQTASQQTSDYVLGCHSCHILMFCKLLLHLTKTDYTPTQDLEYSGDDPIIK